jgi:hypothetical protein
MVLGNWGPSKFAAVEVARLEESITHRFGWRRVRRSLLFDLRGPGDNGEV